MQLTVKRGSLFLGMVAALVIMMALASSPASATAFCVGQKVNNTNKCWGASRTMIEAVAEGETTGVCVGADLTAGQCAPTGQQAIVGTTYAPHAPWVIGTASAFTVVGYFTHTNP
jgi:predicted lysophospholipase L1 biosynthesis ABC-type transport system permease subunit